MTLTDINKALSNLAEQPTRENILAFSFELLQWMNIAPNTENKPQLLSPQTQKLKDYLANAPQTVQPQLYRLSADNQNIRVRFAVLKKLKKEYISQLVDNDPGLGSYQAMAKGLTKPATGTVFIPTQPYFVHFVTTSDYDKLVLIFNQGEQKRIVTFRNRLTNTQYHKIIEAWHSLGTKAKPEIADIFWKSLDIKEVNKEFYKQIKERFDTLLGIVKTQYNIATDNQVKQFTVRLIGRYIFCWFLKEKGIIPHSLISKLNIEETDQYYQTVLLKLFFETLNTKVQDRDPSKHNKLFEKVPYLNGGLFDESEEDKLFTKLQLDAWLLPFVEILESYDFTVDESSSQYQQVAVDPEMLGRIFENLLASQNEETEKLANQRKAFGAFYTPREIVDYMVNESIKTYLQTQWEQQFETDKTKYINNPEPIGDIFGNKKPQQLVIETKRYELKPEEKLKIEKILEPLFLTNPDTGGLKKEEKNLLLNFLEQIKILDPACGSGAFPMGILQKLVELHETLGTVKSSYELKKDILSHNIYGVDIMPMAIEIARLRAWLSLVLEEDYKPNDPKHNFGVKPLPNLDFKFVCANSLIDLGLDNYLLAEKGKLGLYEKFFKQLKELETLRKKFFSPDLEHTAKEELKNQYLNQRNDVIAEIEADSDSRLKSIANKIKNWNPFDDSKASSFFSTTWMFGIDKGFDIVIGNPPYVRADNPAIAKQRKIIMESNDYATLWEKWDLMIPFVERSVILLAKGGVNTFILSNSITTSKYAEKLHDWLIKNYFVKSIDYFEDIEVFEAGVVPIILTIQKVSKTNKKSKKNYRVKEFANVSTKMIDNNDLLNLKSKIFRASFSNIFSSEIESECLKNICYISYGLRPNSDEKLYKGEFVAKDLISASKDEIHCKEYVEGKQISKYEIHKIKFIEWGTERVPSKLVRPTFPNLYSGEKLFLGVLTGGTYNNTGIICNHSIVVAKRFIDLHLIKERSISVSISKNNIAGKGSKTSAIVNRRRKELENISKDFELKYLLAIINSSYAMAFLNNFRRHRLENYFYPDDFRNLPIPKISLQKQKQFVEQVEKIISFKKKNQDTRSLENQIDVMVCKLFELSYEEIKIIDKDFGLSEEEYDNCNFNKKK